MTDVASSRKMTEEQARDANYIEEEDSVVYVFNVDELKKFLRNCKQ